MKNAFALLFLCALFVHSQTPSTRSASFDAAAFDAASIKPSTADAGGTDVDTDNGLLRMHNVTLRLCIMSAYAIPERQVLGGSKWMDDLRYDIIARTSRTDDKVDLMAMLQSLLADRFRLALHHETQSLTGYGLTTAKGGIKAAPSGTDGSNTNGGRGRIDAKGATMSRLAMRLSGLLNAPVVDMTEEPRRFDFSLRWVPDQMLSGSAAADAPNGPSLFTALQEQLGLKLESRRVPVDVLVIDHAELASEN